MLCKSDKPSIIIITYMNKEYTVHECGTYIISITIHTFPQTFPSTTII